MDRKEFAAEFGGILGLLRDHAFLAYSPSGRREYEQKIRSCAEQFAYLVFKKTGIPVTVLPGLVPIEGARDASFSSGRSLALRVAKSAHAAAMKASGLDREYFDRCATLWARAAEKLSEADPK